MRRHVGWWSLLCVAMLLWSCSDTKLYSRSSPRKEADRIALRGRACSEDPVEAKFPIRVIMVVDQAAGNLFSDYDPGGTRISVMRDFVQRTLNLPEAEMAIIGYAGRPRILAPLEGNVTRNPGELFNAVAQLSIPQPCLDEELCRDTTEALRTARTLIEGDLSALPSGLRVLTQYVVVVVQAGRQKPLVRVQDCCEPDDGDCLMMDGYSAGCEATLAAQDVAEMRDLVADSGASGLRLHTIQLPASDSAAFDDAQESVLEQMAFAGGGTSQRFNQVAGFNLTALDLLGLRTVLRAKLLIAANLNARPGPEGPLVDSDADGLADIEEDLNGNGLLDEGETSPIKADTDEDGVSDRVEVFAGFEPTVPEQPKACLGIEPGADQDLDGLTDCDEELLGTDPTLVDTDGDGMPDRLEVISLTDYVHRDAELDEDGDGVSNGDEILLHADPRSTDTREHLSSGYRYEIEDLGVSRELFASKPIRATGVEVTELSQGTTAGLGIMSVTVDAQGRSLLQWQDASDNMPGEPVDITAGGEFVIRSFSGTEERGQEGPFITVRVDPVELPPSSQKESIRVIFRERQCLDYTIRNIRLVETLEREDGTPAGQNDILLYFAQAPEDRVEVPGPFRLALVPIRFAPPAPRDPDEAILEVRDDEFVRPEFDAP